MVLVNEKLKMSAREGEDRDAFVERCLVAADRADDASQDRVKKRYEGRMKTLRKRLDKERDELQRRNEELDQQRAALLSTATDEANAERQRLLEAARQAADALSAKRQEALRNDALYLNQAIRRKTCRGFAPD